MLAAAVKAMNEEVGTLLKISSTWQRRENILDIVHTHYVSWVTHAHGRLPYSCYFFILNSIAQYFLHR